MRLFSRNYFFLQAPLVFITLSIIPILIFFLSYSLSIIKGPFFLGINSDPAYQYLFNSLLMLHLIPPIHIDHPGTTVQLFGAVVIWVKYFFTQSYQNTLPLRYSVITNAESYLGIINTLIVTLIAATTFFTGFKVYKLSRQKLIAIIFQISLLLFPTVIKATTQVSPEPMLILVVIILSCAFLPTFLDAENHDPTMTHCIIIGTILGFGIATKVTMVPLILFCLIPDGLNNKILTFISCIFSFFVFTLPIATHYHRMLDWFISIAVHAGIHGGGPEGLPEMKTLWSNLAMLIEKESVFFIFFGIITIFTIIFFFKRKVVFQTRTGKNNYKGIVVISLIIFTQIMITVKHPSIHYMLPSMVLAGLSIVILLNLIQAVFGGNRTQYASIRYVLIFLVILCLPICLLKIQRTKHFYSAYRDAATQIEKKINSSYKDYMVIEYYGSSSIQHALFFGNSSCRGAFRKTLNPLYPNTIVYNTLSKQFYTYSGFLFRKTLNQYLKNGTKFLMRGRPFKSEKDKQYPPVKMRQVYINSAEALYTIESFDY